MSGSIANTPSNANNGMPGPMSAGNNSGDNNGAQKASAGGNFKGKRSGGSRNTPLTGATQNPKTPSGGGMLTPNKQPG